MSAAKLRADVAIVGAGTAGLAAERSARRAGATTLLIDDGFAGTTCASVGCMPSKLLIAAARAAHTVNNADVFGLRTSLSVDGTAVMTRVRKERDAFVAATRKQLAELPKGVAVQGRARFVDHQTLSLDDGQHIDARTIVIATGSHPSVPKVFAPIKARMLTNETVFELPTLPKSLGVVGSGPLGLELAQAMARLGVSVAVFDAKDRLAGLDDPQVAQCLKQILGRELDLHLGVELQARMGEDAAILQWTGAGKGQRGFERVLIAAGRPPNLADMNLAATGLNLDQHGVPVFDRETMQCGDSPVFIAGDADADRPVLHEASDEGAIAGYNAARFPRITRQRRTVPMSIMFTDPPLVVIGRQSGENLLTGTSNYRDQGRAKVEARAEGLARVHARPQDAALLGACLLCPGADHLGHLLAWSIDAQLTADAVLNQPFYHPTLKGVLENGVAAAV